VRNRARFREHSPDLELERASWLPWFGYLASGGITRRNLVPGLLAPVVQDLDRMLAPLDRWTALHWHLTVRKHADGK